MVTNLVCRSEISLNILLLFFAISKILMAKGGSVSIFLLLKRLLILQKSIFFNCIKAGNEDTKH